MLRDKFIHYFQQWRERQLSRGEHWLAQHRRGVRRVKRHVTGRGRVPVLRRILRPHLAAVERADRTTGDDVAAAGGDERATEEHCAGYYCGAKIRHDNASTGIAGHQ